MDEFDSNFSVYHCDDWDTSTIASDVTSTTVFSVSTVNYTNNTASKHQIKRQQSIHKITQIGNRITTTILHHL